MHESFTSYFIESFQTSLFQTQNYFFSKLSLYHTNCLQNTIIIFFKYIIPQTSSPFLFNYKIILSSKLSTIINNQYQKPVSHCLLIQFNMFSLIFDTQNSFVLYLFSFYLKNSKIFRF